MKQLLALGLSSPKPSRGATLLPSPSCCSTRPKLPATPAPPGQPTSHHSRPWRADEGKAWWLLCLRAGQRGRAAARVKRCPGTPVLATARWHWKQAQPQRSPSQPAPSPRPQATLPPALLPTPTPQPSPRLPKRGQRQPPHVGGQVPGVVRPLAPDVAGAAQGGGAERGARAGEHVGRQFVCRDACKALAVRRSAAAISLPSLPLTCSPTT